MVQDIRKQLQIIVNSESEDITYITICRVILENIQKGIEDITILELAEICYTSPSTISRFVKKLGYSNFNEFKMKCIERKNLGTEILSDNVKNISFNSKNDKDVLIDLVDSINISLREFVEKLDLNEIDRLVNMIHNYEDIYFFGFHLSGYFMQHLQYNLFNLGKYVNFASQERSQERLANQTNENSLSIIFSVDGNFIRQKSQIFYSLKENRGKIVLVTQNPALKMASQCDYVIYLGNYKSATEGRYKLHLFTEILINRYYQKYSK
ncbi:MurR/RpiR family transcriptional regulator [Clostridioides sp. ES-S-0108-01]|uniref:MurR/RpiR family transcriptional regulator n=1 Tax=Clostridioides sp. ES-S-0108-01 TaxID=2770773 RepID=UPI001D0C2F60|nr:MurR/RpiR family transcriptional regulator [Clostridioides sp. ES-S-0108-01]UDN50454.1 MurR/RpiR family transcriptional regulator [Clostridioides sp. ES-S-0107-01]